MSGQTRQVDARRSASSKLDIVPKELKRLHQWVGSKDGVPKNPRRPRNNAKTNDPATWGTFEQAVAGMQAGHYDAIAFVFTEDDPYVGIDLDACRNPETGEIADWAQEIVDQLDTYTEISRSGTGLHLVLKIADEKSANLGNHVTKLRGVPTFGSKAAEIRCSWERQALSITADVFESLEQIRKLSEAYQQFIAQHFPEKKPIATTGRASHGMTKLQREVLQNLLEHIDPTADRSGVEFYACCVALRMGSSNATFWDLAQHHGKFAERGRKYFDLTWKKADVAVASGIVNAITLPNNKRQPLKQSEIIEVIYALTGSWPRRVGGMLFVHDPKHGIAFLATPASLFAWLHSTVGTVIWFARAGCVTKEELFHELRRIARIYDGIQEVPHEPLLAHYYYASSTVASADGGTLDSLIDCFTPATPLDRTLVLAAFLTPFWGGSAGARPILVITAAGRGHGKTTLATCISLLLGGCLTFSKGEDIAVIIQRLLSPDGLKARMVLLDNLKSLKFSWAEFEALITALVISGKQMYVGEARRPNHITYFLTGNALALSTDIAQRSVILELGRPNHDGDWFPAVRDFILEHRDALIADIIGYLRRPAVRLAQHSRWGEWEDGVLAKLPDAEKALRLIIERRGAADVDAVTAETVEAYFLKKLSANGYDADRQRIRIPTGVAVTWFNAATDQEESVTRASALLRQMADEGQLKRLAKSKSNKHGRVFLWTGKAFKDGPTIDFEAQRKRS